MRIGSILFFTLLILGLSYFSKAKCIPVVNSLSLNRVNDSASDGACRVWPINKRVPAELGLGAAAAAGDEAGSAFGSGFDTGKRPAEGSPSPPSSDGIGQPDPKKTKGGDDGSGSDDSTTDTTSYPKGITGQDEKDLYDALENNPITTLGPDDQLLFYCGEEADVATEAFTRDYLTSNPGVTLKHINDILNVGPFEEARTAYVKKNPAKEWIANYIISDKFGRIQASHGAQFHVVYSKKSQPNLPVDSWFTHAEAGPATAEGTQATRAIRWDIEGDIFQGDIEDVANGLKPPNVIWIKGEEPMIQTSVDFSVDPRQPLQNYPSESGSSSEGESESESSKK